MEKLAVLGTGLLGRAVALRLHAAGHSMVAYNRTRSRTIPLQQAGIPVADRPEDAIQSADCVLLLLADMQAIRATLLSEPAKEAMAGRVVIQMGTIAPQESVMLSEAVQAAGGDYLEAPVLGSIAEAKAGTLLVMVGGTQKQFIRWGEVWRSLSRELRLVGPVGQAAALKLALNQLIAAEIAAFSISLGLIHHAGVPTETFMDVLRHSALFAPTFEKKLPRLLAGDYTDPNFSVNHLLKDVDLCLQASAVAGMDATPLAAVRPLLKKAIGQGLGELDYSAIYSVINPPVPGERKN